MRVGLSYDLLRLSLRLGDLYDKPQNKMRGVKTSAPLPIKQKHLFQQYSGPRDYYYFSSIIRSPAFFHISVGLAIFIEVCLVIYQVYHV